MVLIDSTRPVDGGRQLHRRRDCSKQRLAESVEDLITLLRQRHAEDTAIKLGPNAAAIDRFGQIQLALKAALLLFQIVIVAALSRYASALGNPRAVDEFLKQATRFLLHL